MRAWPSWDEHCSELLMHLLGSYLDEMATVETAMAPDAVLEDELWQKFHVTLNRREKKMLRELADELRSRGDKRIPSMAGKNMESLSKDEKEELAISLMLSRNKTTHIYELVKAYGSLSQISYDRPSRTWHRTETIGRKHGLEYSVNPFSGKYVSGDAHAPLVYATDPREDMPFQLREHLAEKLKDIDHRVVEG